MKKAKAVLIAAEKLATDRSLADQHTATSIEGIQIYKAIIESALEAYQQHVEMAPLIQQPVQALQVLPKVLLIGLLQ